MKTLLINGHPDFKEGQGFSLQLQKFFEKTFHEEFPDEELTILNLYDFNLPRVENDSLWSAWSKQMVGVDLDDKEKEALSLNRQLLDQFKEHHRIVIVGPLHNFSVTSRIKDYLDNIMIARETFKYTEQGSVGLMTDDYKVWYIQGSGSIFSDNGKYSHLEHSTFYLKDVFVDVMGFDEFYLSRAEGTTTQPVDKEAILKKGKESMLKQFKGFYSSNS